jgi:hypothetical protein
VRGLDVPLAEVRADRARAGARLPLPLLDVRPAPRRRRRVRPRRPRPAAAPDPHRPGQRPGGNRRLLRTCRPLVRRLAAGEEESD